MPGQQPTGLGRDLLDLVLVGICGREPVEQGVQPAAQVVEPVERRLGGRGHDDARREGQPVRLAVRQPGEGAALGILARRRGGTRGAGQADVAQLVHGARG